MLKLLCKEKEEGFLSFCQNCTDKVNGAVLYTRLKAYGTDSGEALFWYSEDKDKITSCSSLFDGVFTFVSGNNAPFSDIRLFPHIIGASEVLCSLDSFQKTGFEEKSIRKSLVLKFKGSDKFPAASEVTAENLKEIFPVIFEENPDKDKIFPYWYTDASHKLRHGLIRGKAVYADGKCVSVCITSGETNNTAVISSAATLKAYRKNGFGECAVISLAKASGKEAYVVTDSVKTAEWYEKLGFELTKNTLCSFSL